MPPCTSQVGDVMMVRSACEGEGVRGGCEGVSR